MARIAQVSSDHSMTIAGHKLALIGQLFNDVTLAVMACKTLVIGPCGTLTTVCIQNLEQNRALHAPSRLQGASD